MEAGGNNKVNGFVFWTLENRVVDGNVLQEPLARVTFSAYPTCHDVNLFTASPERLDVVIGFHTGDLMWFG